MKHHQLSLMAAKPPRRYTCACPTHFSTVGNSKKIDGKASVVAATLGWCRACVAKPPRASADAQRSTLDDDASSRDTAAATAATTSVAMVGAFRSPPTQIVSPPSMGSTTDSTTDSTTVVAALGAEIARLNKLNVELTAKNAEVHAQLTAASSMAQTVEQSAAAAASTIVTLERNLEQARRERDTARGQAKSVGTADSARLLAEQRANAADATCSAATAKTAEVTQELEATTKARDDLVEKTTQLAAELVKAAETRKQLDIANKRMRDGQKRASRPEEAQTVGDYSVGQSLGWFQPGETAAIHGIVTQIVTGSLLRAVSSAPSAAAATNVDPIGFAVRLVDAQRGGAMASEVMIPLEWVATGVRRSTQRMRRTPADATAESMSIGAQLETIKHNYAIHRNAQRKGANRKTEAPRSVQQGALAMGSAFTDGTKRSIRKAVKEQRNCSLTGGKVLFPCAFCSEPLDVDDCDVGHVRSINCGGPGLAYNGELEHHVTCNLAHGKRNCP